MEKISTTFGNLEKGHALGMRELEESVQMRRPHSTHLHQRRRTAQVSYRDRRVVGGERQGRRRAQSPYEFTKQRHPSLPHNARAHKDGREASQSALRVVDTSALASCSTLT